MQYNSFWNDISFHCNYCLARMLKIIDWFYNEQNKLKALSILNRKKEKRGDGIILSLSYDNYSQNLSYFYTIFDRREYKKKYNAAKGDIVRSCQKGNKKNMKSLFKYSPPSNYGVLRVKRADLVSLDKIQKNCSALIFQANISLCETKDKQIVLRNDLLRGYTQVSPSSLK